MCISQNAVSFAAMNSLMSTVVPLQLQLNIDGSHFCAGSDDNGQVVVKYRERDTSKPLKLKVYPESGKGGLRFSIKRYALISTY